MRHLTALAAAILLCSGPVTSQIPSEAVDLGVVSQIRAEAQARSHLMDTVEYLTDVTGGRLTGSPGLRQAQQYARDTLRSWGLEAHLEPWGPFGRGWSFVGLTAALTAPTFSPLIAYPKAWSASTAGAVEGEPVFLDVTAPADVERYRGKLRGRIVLFAPARAVSPIPDPIPGRTSNSELEKLANAPSPGPGPPTFEPTPAQRSTMALNYAKWQLVYSEGAAVVLEPGSGEGGTVYVTAAALPVSPDVPAAQRPHPWDVTRPQVVPQVVIAAEQYNRLVRLIARGVAVRLSIRVDARYDDTDPMSANVIGEMAGTDLKDEVVMFGGCLDSWHTGTGATDNAAGAGVALEAMRILQALGLKPRRTIRVGLWAAEEQGTLGSHAYVAAHLGTRVVDRDGQMHVVRGPDYDKVTGYFNLDYGTGRIRGVYLQGNDAVRPIFRAWLAPFADLGASTLSSAGMGATDHVPFDEIGVPGFQFIRDYMEGNGGPAHTNMDVFDHVLESDLKQSAAIVAAFAYELAMRNDKLPRKH
jgi:carboxypeptidase Q